MVSIGYTQLKVANTCLFVLFVWITPLITFGQTNKNAIKESNLSGLYKVVESSVDPNTYVGKIMRQYFEPEVWIDRPKDAEASSNSSNYQPTRDRASFRKMTFEGNTFRESGWHESFTPSHSTHDGHRTGESHLKVSYEGIGIINWENKTIGIRTEGRTVQKSTPSYYKGQPIKVQPSLAQFLNYDRTEFTERQVQFELLGDRKIKIYQLDGNTKGAWTTYQKVRDSKVNDVVEVQANNGMGVHDHEKPEIQVKSELIGGGFDVDLAMIGSKDEANNWREAMQQVAETGNPSDIKGAVESEDIGTVETEPRPKILDMAVVDHDKDKRFDTVILEYNNGHRYVSRDLDGDGSIDEVIEFDQDGTKVEKSAQIHLTMLNQSFNKSGVDEIKALEHLIAGQNSLGLNSGENGSWNRVLGDGVEDNPFLVRSLTFENGILNSFEEARETAYDISTMAEIPVNLIYNESNGFAADILESTNIEISSGLHLSTGKFIAGELRSGKNHTHVVHSQGAQHTLASLDEIRIAVTEAGLPQDALQNLTIVTVGGFSPTADQWPSDFNVIALNNNDPTAAIGGYPTDLTQASLRNHPISMYYPALIMLTDPTVDITKLHGSSFNSSEWSLMWKLLTQ